MAIGGKTWNLDWVAAEKLCFSSRMLECKQRVCVVQSLSLLAELLAARHHNTESWFVWYEWNLYHWRYSKPGGVQLWATPSGFEGLLPLSRDLGWRPTRIPLYLDDSMTPGVGVVCMLDGIQSLINVFCSAPSGFLQSWSGFCFL